MANVNFDEFILQSKEYIEQKTQKLIDKALNLLSIKYGEDFKPCSIGNRIDTDYVDIYLTPEDGSVLFRARIDSEGEGFSDNYISRKAGAELADNLVGNLEKNGINSAAAVFPMVNDDSDEDNPQIELKGYFDEYDIHSVMVYVIVDKPRRDDIGVLTELLGKMSCDYGIDVNVYAAAVENYSECSQEISDVPDLTSSWFLSFGVTANIRFAVSGGKCNVGNDLLESKWIEYAVDGGKD